MNFSIDHIQVIAHAARITLGEAEKRLLRISKDSQLLDAYYEVSAQMGSHTLITDVKRRPDQSIEVSVMPVTAGRAGEPTKSPMLAQAEEQLARLQMHISKTKFEIGLVFGRPKTAIGSGVVAWRTAIRAPHWGEEALS